MAVAEPLIILIFWFELFMALLQKQSYNILGKLMSLSPSTQLMVSFSKFSVLHCVWP